MTFIVTWSPGALAELARVAAAVGDPKAVDQATVWIDSILRRVPLDMGESRAGKDRLWYSDLLGVYYRVDDEKMTVRVMAVGPSRRR
jgi:plasmid stabilization system protein ParE